MKADLNKISNSIEKEVDIINNLKEEKVNFLN